MKKLRQKLTDTERKVGNFFYDGLGEILSTNINKKELAGLGAASLLSLGLGSLSGCATDEGGYLKGLGVLMSENRDPLVRAVGKMSYYKGDHDDRMREARARRSQINIYSNNSERDSSRNIYRNTNRNYQRDTYNNSSNEYPTIFTQNQNKNGIRDVFYLGDSVYTYVDLRRMFKHGVNFPLAIKNEHLESGNVLIDEFSDSTIRDLYNKPKSRNFYLSEGLYLHYDVPLGEYENTLIGDIDGDGEWERLLSTKFVVLE